MLCFFFVYGFLPERDRKRKNYEGDGLCNLIPAEVSGGRVRGRPRLGWMDGVKVALGNRGMTVEAAQQCAKDRKARRALVHM